jgi:hypothetical protein
MPVVTVVCAVAVVTRSEAAAAIIKSFFIGFVPQDTHFLMKPYEPQQLLDAVLR